MSNQHTLCPLKSYNLFPSCNLIMLIHGLLPLGKGAAVAEKNSSNYYKHKHKCNLHKCCNTFVKINRIPCTHQSCLKSQSYSILVFITKVMRRMLFSFENHSCKNAPLQVPRAHWKIYKSRKRKNAENCLSQRSIQTFLAIFIPFQ